MELQYNLKFRTYFKTLTFEMGSYKGRAKHDKVNSGEY